MGNTVIMEHPLIKHKIGIARKTRQIQNNIIMEDGHLLSSHTLLVQIMAH